MDTKRKINKTDSLTVIFSISIYFLYQYLVFYNLENERIISDAGKKRKDGFQRFLEQYFIDFLDFDSISSSFVCVTVNMNRQIVENMTGSGVSTVIRLVQTALHTLFTKGKS